MASIFEDAGFSLPNDGPKKGPVAASSASKDEPKSIFTDAGFDLPKKSAIAIAPPAENPMGYDLSKQSQIKNPAPKSELQKIREEIDPARLLSIGASNTLHDTVEAAVAGAARAKQGYGELRQGQYAPSFPSSDPKTWEAGGVLNTAGGALGVVAASPISGPINALVSRPVTEMTGNPNIGDRAGILASSFIPIKVPGKIAAVAGPEARSVNELVHAIGPENVPEAVARLRENPRLSVADVNDTARTLVQGMIDPAQPHVQNLVSGIVKDRAKTLPAATNSAYTEAMGSAPDVVKMVEGLTARAKEAGAKEIQPAIARAGPVDVSGALDAIDKELKPGILGLQSGLPLSPRQQELWRLRNQLQNPETGETLVDASRLHEIQSQTGNKAYQLQKSSDGWTRDVGSGLRDVNEKIIGAIDDASGGAYRPARAKFKEAKDIQEAWESGFDTLKNRSGVPGLEDRPEALKKWMNGASPEEVVARRIGTRADIDQKIKSVKNQALAGQTITKIEYNKEKLRTLFGEQEANRLIRVMEDAGDEAATNYRLLQGSKTAETLAGREALKVRDVKGGNPLQYAVPFMSEFLGAQYGIPGTGAAMMGLKGLQLGAQKIGQQMDLARNYNFTKNALASGEAREGTINALLSHPAVQKELKARALSSRSISQQSNNALLPPP